MVQFSRTDSCSRNSFNRELLKAVREGNYDRFICGGW